MGRSSAVARGHLVPVHERDDGGREGNLPPWQALIVDAVGNTIDFWHFKRNHGRVWAVLYLEGRAHSAAELKDALGLSKGAVSMVTRELESWGVIRRVRTPGDATWRFVSETDLMKMIRRVIADREGAFVARVREDLEAGAAMAVARGGVPADILARVARLKTLARIVDKALQAFLLTGRLDVGAVAAVLLDPLYRKRK